jgi:hypothetical protein
MKKNAIFFVVGIFTATILLVFSFLENQVIMAESCVCTEDCVDIVTPAEPNQVTKQTGECICTTGSDWVIGAIQKCEDLGSGYCNVQKCRWWKSCCKSGPIPEV